MAAAFDAFDKKADKPWQADDEITVERRVKTGNTESPLSSRRTTPMTRIDSRLLAIARGELDPEEADPFGGLIPIYDEDAAVEAPDEWLVLDPDPEVPHSSGASGASEADETTSVLIHACPFLRLRPDEVMVLPVGERTAFFASQIDGRRSLTELGKVCALDDLEILEVVDELLRMGAIDLR